MSPAPSVNSEKFCAGSAAGVLLAVLPAVWTDEEPILQMPAGIRPGHPALGRLGQALRQSGAAGPRHRRIRSQYFPLAQRTCHAEPAQTGVRLVLPGHAFCSARRKKRPSETCALPPDQRKIRTSTRPPLFRKKNTQARTLRPWRGNADTIGDRGDTKRQKIGRQCPHYPLSLTNTAQALRTSDCTRKPEFRTPGHRASHDEATQNRLRRETRSKKPHPAANRQQPEK